MSVIKVLDPSLANMIAAGEVVEGPSSVVKELLENSIDAKATSITIRLEDYGKKSIEVRDDGEGMSKEDLLLAFTRHATSKISTKYDLFNISTLGFRGEALPSIAAISRVTVESCVKDAIGWKAIVEEAKIKEIVPGVARVGTTVTVKNLFYNTPARLKHLRSDYTELANVIDVVTNIAFGYPKKKIELYNGDKRVFYSSGRGQLKEIIAQAYGVESARQMLEVNCESKDFTIKGYISTFVNHRASRKYMTFLLNSRAVRIPQAQNAIIEAYQNFLPVNRYPITILDISADPHLVDVNVHPSKREVRLSKDDILYKQIKEVIRATLEKASTTPKVEVSEKESVIKPMLNLDEEDLSKAFKVFSAQETKNEYDSDIKSDGLVLEEKVEAEERPRMNRMRPIGQIHGTYIVAESVDGFYLIDQHAAMERINFEKFSISLANNRGTTDILIPKVIELSHSEIEIMKNKLELLESVGIKAEIFGVNALRVTGVPLWMQTLDINIYVNEIIEQILHNQDINIFALRSHAVATLACKASLKANRSLTLEEEQELLDNLMLCKNPHTCPHGRPTMIFYSKYEIEKLFRRVV